MSPVPKGEPSVPKSRIVEKDRDKQGRKMPDAEQRRERSRRGGAASHSLAAYVKRIVRDAPQLSAADLSALRQILEPITYAEVYNDGLKAGAKMATERLLAAVHQLAAAEL